MYHTTHCPFVFFLFFEYSFSSMVYSLSLPIRFHIVRAPYSRQHWGKSYRKSFYLTKKKTLFFLFEEKKWICKLFCAFISFNSSHSNPVKNSFVINVHSHEILFYLVIKFKTLPFFFIASLSLFRSLSHILLYIFNAFASVCIQQLQFFILNDDVNKKKKKFFGNF